MTGAVILYFLVLGNANGLTTIPQPYKTVEACKAAGEVWISKGNFRGWSCIPWEAHI